MNNLTFHTICKIAVCISVGIVLMGCGNLFNSGSGKFRKSQTTLPHIVDRNGVKQLYVNDKPFLIIGGELLNSSASDIEYMKTVWPRVKKLNLNTLLIPVTWQQFETQEGEFDYTLIRNHLEQAEEHKLHLIILWYGSWKNGESHTAPDWVKTNMQRYPRMVLNDGEITATVSNFSDNCFRAEKRAYVKLLEFIAEEDRTGRVVMIQIENEVGLLGDSRDFSKVADSLYAGQVPMRLMYYLADNIETLKPELQRLYMEHGSLEEGSWEKVFGRSLMTNEIFMAWYYASYINELAKAGKAVHNVPTLVNAWAADTLFKPGIWPSGGPNYRMLDIWQAAVTHIDVLAIDNYSDDFDLKCKQFRHNGNPLFIPEACAIWVDDTLSAGAKAFYTFGHHAAMCFSPFGIDHDVYHSEHSIKYSYELLNDLMPLIAQSQVEKRINAFMEDVKVKTKSFELGNYKFTPAYNLRKASHIKGYGLILQTRSDEFIIAGNAFQLHFESVDENKPNVQLISVEEGSFIDGIWVRKRILTGDDFDIKLPARPYNRKENVMVNEVGILKVKLFRY